MTPEIRQLIEISRYYGGKKEFVIAGGGNTSFKDDRTIWIKASGHSLASLDEDGLVALDRVKLHGISKGLFPDDPVLREEKVKNDLSECMTDRTSGKRPSVETSLHEVISYRFVVHLHPTKVNGLLCSRNAKNLTLKLFGEKVLFVPYTDPGYTLFKKLESEISVYRQRHGTDPRIIFLENHGSFVSADSPEEIKDIYREIIETLDTFYESQDLIQDLPYDPVMTRVMPAMRMLLSEGKPGIVRQRNNTLIDRYTQSHQEFHKISLPVTPDIIVYCKAKYLYIDQAGSAEKILDSLKHQLPRFRNEYGYLPKVVIIKGKGIFAVEDTVSSADSVLDVYEDLIKVSNFAVKAGGVKFLTPDQIDFIDRWEVENYRRKVNRPKRKDNSPENRIAVVTGGAQGFGAGIAESLFRSGVNVVVADLNEETGSKFVSCMTSVFSTNSAIFVKADVSDPGSVSRLIERTVNEFGGIDILISNAGVLKAGGLDEMDPGDFSRTTMINYNGYFNCAKYASEIMKLQHEENPGHFMDIIQINSKSGLRGSNRNFAYSGSKFGGIGLTQSFALELAPFRIKVNAICPGNFYEGPLWSDPKNGLFVQYLKTGKVPGAKTIEDVRKFYEDQVPLKRGCRLEDVVKAILYVIDQEYETGQAIPVTGGQIMLG